jgi:hypothetical protein
MPLKPRFKDSNQDAHLADITLSEAEDAELSKMQRETLSFSRALHNIGRYDSYAAYAGFMNAYIAATAELRARSEIRAKKARIKQNKPK